MFGLGPTELVIILILAIVIFGPSRLPQVARSLGESVRGFRKVKESTDNIQGDLQKELEEVVLGPREEKK
ncbi:MAG: twin-arginine translocase TatA/TatE family subunit [Actinobacteria bacterium]|nr:twin-arginine translocase TatA/TatE family subunit [Actinomycetota bacterium]